MLDIIGKIWKNKIFAVFMILIIITAPVSFYTQSDKDKTIVTSSIGIELEDDEYKVTILAVIPKGSNDVNANLETFDANGKTISEALDKISFDLGKKIGLAHCDSIIFTKEIMQSNLTQVLDYFIRTANLSTNPTLIATEDSAKDLLSAVKSSNNLLDLSLKNIIDSQEERTLLDNTTIDRFYRAYLSNNTTFAIPMLSVKSSSGNESGGGGSGSTGNLPKEDSGGEQSSSSTQEQKNIKNETKIAVLKNGQFQTFLNDDEKFIYALLTKPSHYQKFTLENINDKHFINSTLVFQETDKIIIPHYRIIDGKPVVEYNIWLSIMLDEVKSQDNHSYDSVSGIKNLLTDTVKNEFHNQITNKLKNTNEKMQESNYDILNLYEKFDAYEYKQFHKYLSSLNNPNNYMSEISIKINLKLNYVI